jgi:hypothetical protein
LSAMSVKTNAQANAPTSKCLPSIVNHKLSLEFKGEHAGLMGATPENTSLGPLFYGITQSKVQSPKSKVQSSKFKVRSFKVRSSKFKVRSSKFKVRSSKFEGRSSKFEVRSSKFKVQSSKFEVQSSKFEGPRSKVQGMVHLVENFFDREIVLWHPEYFLCLLRVLASSLFSEVRGKAAQNSRNLTLPKIVCLRDCPWPPTNMG